MAVSVSAPLHKVFIIMNDAHVIDKAQGALIGSAIGDAIGIFTGPYYRTPNLVNNFLEREQSS